MTADEELGLDVGFATAIAETEKALLVVLYAEKAWVPRSQLHVDSEVRSRGDHGILIVTPWFARQKKWGKYRENV